MDQMKTLNNQRIPIFAVVDRRIYIYALFMGKEGKKKSCGVGKKYAYNHSFFAEIPYLIPMAKKKNKYGYTLFSTYQRHMWASSRKRKSSSASPTPKPRPHKKQKLTVDHYQVFLSFRGPDTRNDFTDVLYEYMDRAGIRVFRDDTEIIIGQPINTILHAIEDSEICVVILSESFASSTWCLREVVKMVELGKEVVPIFYKISPDDVKLKTDHPYKTAMAQHIAKHGKKKVEKWKSALMKIAENRGMEVSANTRFTEFCKKFVDEVLGKLKPRKNSTTEHLVGMDSQIESVMELLDTKSQDVRYIGIHGLGGIGKTTLAKAVFEKLSTATFDSSCFLGDVCESSSNNKDLQDLQKNLQARLYPETIKDCNSFREGMFKEKKVLIVLDDVDKSEKIDKLAGELCRWFGPGSRILITAKNVDVLKGLDQKDVRLFEMGTLNTNQALELFQWYAFRKEKPATILESISRKIVSTTGGLPLALKVIGSRLYNNNNEAVWREVLRILKSRSFREVKETLKISYDALEGEEKQIFLDIACIPAMAEKQKAVYLWAASEFYPHLSLDVLCSMSLVKIVNGNKIWMHSLLKDLGKGIVREESVNEPGKRSRVWENEEARNVLLNKGQGKEEVEALCLDEPLEMILTSEHFARFQRLRILKLVGPTIEGDFEDLLPKLVWFSWHLCPPIMSATNLSMKNLVILDLSFSFINETWGGWSLIQIMNNLKVLDLSNCSSLTRTPDFLEYSCLERLELRCCHKLCEVHRSIGKLKRLRYLNLTECYSLGGLPKQIGRLQKLEELRLSGSWMEKIKTFKVPKSIGRLQSLVVLELAYLEIATIPKSIGRLTKLKNLSLSGCSKVEVLPKSIGSLKSLVELKLSKISISKLPSSIVRLVKLEVLNFSGCSDLEVLPESFGRLQELKVLKLKRCKVKKLPVSIGMMKKLEEIEFYSTGLLEELPEEIGNLSSLRKLTLTGSSISTLPSTINELPFLEELDLRRNHELIELPDLPFSLRKLQVSSRSLQRTPNFSRLTNLTDLRLLNIDDYRCPKQLSAVSKFEGIKELTKLQRLDLGLANATSLPLHSGSLNLLEFLGLDFQEELKCASLPDLSNLKNLSGVTFSNCLLKDGVDSLGIRLLEKVTNVWLRNCVVEVIEPFVSKKLRFLSIDDCESLKTLPDLSQLKNLSYLQVMYCKELVEIPGLGELESLNTLCIHQCESLLRLESFSKLENLSSVSLSNCPKLSAIRGSDKLVLTSLMIYNCICISLQNKNELMKRSKEGRVDRLRFESFVRN